MTDAGPVYRGHASGDLLHRRFETVAELLWTGSLEPKERPWEARGLGLVPLDLRALVPAGSSPVDALTLLLPALALRDPDRFGAPEETEHHRARRLLLRMAALMAAGQELARCAPALKGVRVAHIAAASLGAEPSGPAAQAIDRVLVLCADGPLDAATMAARLAASVGADLYTCVSASLALANAPGADSRVDRVDTLFQEVARLGVTAAVRARLRRGEEIPGFGSGAVSGDPRGLVLLETATVLRSPRLEPVLELVEFMKALGCPVPGVEIGLLGLVYSLGLTAPQGAGLLVLARTAGWIAHVFEQRRSGALLLPSAHHREMS